MFANLLVPTDFEAASRRALDTALELAKGAGVRLTILHVCEIPAYTYNPESDVIYLERAL